MGKGSFKATSARVEKYLSERDRAQTVMEVAIFLGVTNPTAYGILQLMEIFGKVQKAKRGRSYYYLLTGVYDDEQISAMLPPKKFKPEPRRRSNLRSPMVSKLPGQGSFIEEHLSSMRAQASSVEGPSALAMIGLNQIDVVEGDVVPAVGVALRNLEADVDVMGRRFEPPKKIEPFATIQYLPKEVRPLTQRQTKHLKEQLKGLDEYQGIEKFNIAFAAFSALENGSYGTVFYFSMGTNPWDRVHRVKVEVPISLEMEKPVKRRRGKLRSKYDPILDQFLEGGQDRLEIDTKGRNPNAVQQYLRRRIAARNLGIVAYTKRGVVYLEKRKIKGVITPLVP